MRVVALIVFLLRECLCCPPTCDCKWKSGKESAICVRNNLTHIPKGIDSSTQLLDLTGNRISAIEKDAFDKAGLFNLQKIYLAKCGLRDMDRFAFRRLTNLVELDLSYNSITSVPSHIFDSISELRELKLTGNLIQRVSNEAFINVRQLVKLELSECRIVSLEPRAFSGLEKSLEWLKLEKNRLVEVRPSTFTNLSNLHGLELAGNPWNCSCRLRPLRQWMSIQNVPSSTPASCSHPNRLRGKTWDRLQDNEFACTPVMHRARNSVVQAVEGTNVTLSCLVTGNPTPTVRWLWKNRPIANVSGIPSHRKLYILHYNGSRSTLTVYSAEIADAGVYFCVASNKAGRVQGNVTLAISRRRPESKLTGKVLMVGAAMAFLLFMVSGCLFCIFGQPRKPPRINQAENYEKIEMEKKGESCLSENQPNNRIHPTLCEYRGVPAEDIEEETAQPSPMLVPNASNASRTHLQLTDDLIGVQQHILRKEILPTTSLYTTAAPDDSSIPDVITNPTSIVTAAATLPRFRSKDWYPNVSSSQSPLLAGSASGSSPGEMSISRRYSIESRASARYNSRPRRCERSASSLDLFEPEHKSWQRPSLPPSPTRFNPHRSFQVSETPILNLLDSANHYDYHATQLDRFLDEYRTLQKEINRMKETCQELRGSTTADLFPRYTYRV
ncbi:unnamed protein product [Nezara viridula]|uniref:Ig-like domain-containing protein n=1 Tax=Nezara viridula TaxID=85310 RepID=A0A9P0HT32_NEZVI|nr:unnamed protein product [Nezara viridula]